MSAFFLAINRDKSSFEQDIAESMMAPLDRFGHDARRLFVQDHYAIGYQSHWLVPEEQGEYQPLQVDNDRWFMFYGRLDNRDALLSELNQLNDVTLRSSMISDALLAYRYLLALGVSRLQDLIGPFVLLSFDAVTNKVIVARDGMGARSLAYRITDDHIFIATNELAIVAHPMVDYKLNDETVACQIIGKMQNMMASVISGIDLLYPGHVVECDFSASAKPVFKTKRFYKPDPRRRVNFKSDQQYAAEFKRLLTQAVHRRMRCTGDIGTQLSGGLDSVPITIAAATYVEDHQQPSQSSSLTAYSWVFDDYPEVDERQYSSPLCQKYDIQQVLVNCDKRWMSYDERTPFDPLGPIYNPYSAFNHEVFRQAKSRSVKVMLNGIHGDILYDYTNSVIYELLAVGQLRQAWHQANYHFKQSDSIGSFVKNFILKPLPLVTKILSKRASKNTYTEGILQTRVVEQLSSQGHYLENESRYALRPQQWRLVFGDFCGSDAARGRFFESVYGIERRYPFRDRDLCEFMLAIPSTQLALFGAKRPIVKRAFAKELPENMLNRNLKARFGELMLEGLENDVNNRTWFDSQAREWSHYVKECYFDGDIEKNGQQTIIKWRCGYYAYWKSVCYYPLAKQLGVKQ